MLILLVSVSHIDTMHQKSVVIPHQEFIACSGGVGGFKISIPPLSVTRGMEGLITIPVEVLAAS